MPVLRPCPVCGCAEVVQVNGPPVSRHGMAASVCTSCATVFANPTHTDAEKAARSPDRRLLHRSRSREMEAERAFAHSLRRMTRSFAALSRHVAPGAEALEVACGDGAMLYLMQRAGAEVHGIDMDAEAARDASRRLGVDIVSCEFEAHDFGGRVFDLVVLSHCIEHFYDPVGILRRVRGLTRPGGSVFLETPNVLRPKVGPNRVFSYAHNFHFSPRSLSRAMFEAGLGVSRVVEYGGDVFQVVGRAPMPGEAIATPVGDDWREVAAAIAGYRTRYYATLQFLWRKLPVLRGLMHRTVRDLDGEALRAWLYAPPRPARRAA